jgi:hypothetical protein
MTSLLPLCQLPVTAEHHSSNTRLAVRQLFTRLLRFLQKRHGAWHGIGELTKQDIQGFLSAPLEYGKGSTVAARLRGRCAPSSGWGVRRRRVA